MNNSIQFKNITKNFGKFTVINNISFNVEKGQILGLIGPNGAGKTTTMRLLTGYYKADSGKIEILGKDISKEPNFIKKNIGYLSEGAPLYNDLTAEIFLKFIAKSYNLKSAYLKERMDYVIENLELQDILKQPIETLSKGFKRRVALATAIIHDPAVLILDEPTDGLDPLQKSQIRKLITGLAKDKIIIISTHILEEVENLCTHVAFINKGEIIATDTYENILKKFSHKNKAYKFELNNFDIKKAVALINKKLKNVKAAAAKKGNIITLKTADKNFEFHKLANIIAAENWQINKITSLDADLDYVFKKLIK